MILFEKKKEMHVKAGKNYLKLNWDVSDAAIKKYENYWYFQSADTDRTWMMQLETPLIGL